MTKAHPTQLCIDTQHHQYEYPIVYIMVGHVIVPRPKFVGMRGEFERERERRERESSNTHQGSHAHARAAHSSCNCSVYSEHPPSVVSALLSVVHSLLTIHTPGRWPSSVFARLCTRTQVRRHACSTARPVTPPRAFTTVM